FHDPNADRSRLRELDRVVEEVSKDLLDGTPIRLHRNGLIGGNCGSVTSNGQTGGRHLKGHAQTLGLRRRLEFPHYRTRRFGKVKRLPRTRSSLCLESRKLHQRIERVHQSTTALRDLTREFPKVVRR